MLIDKRIANSQFRESWDRVNRAAFHRKAFIERWNSLIKKNAYRLTINHHPDGTGELGLKRIEPAGSDLALEMGELLYQLRAALDGLVYRGVALKNSGQAVPNEDRLSFPIYKSPKYFPDYDATYLVLLPQEIRDWIKRVQPYNAVNDCDPFIVAIGSCLKILNDCAVKDRHRHLHLIAAHALEANIQVTFNPPVELIQMIGTPCNALDDVSQFAKFRLAQFVPDLNVELKGELRLVIGMSEIPGILGDSLMEVLSSIERVVGIAIQRFEAAFPF